jgi:hypothetical protein
VRRGKADWTYRHRSLTEIAAETGVSVEEMHHRLRLMGMRVDIAPESLVGECLARKLIDWAGGPCPLCGGKR